MNDCAVLACTFCAGRQNVGQRVCIGMLAWEKLGHEMDESWFTDAAAGWVEFFLLLNLAVRPHASSAAPATAAKPTASRAARLVALLLALSALSSAGKWRG